MKKNIVQKYLMNDIAKLKVKREELDQQYKHCVAEGRLDDAAHVREQISILLHKMECKNTRLEFLTTSQRQEPITEYSLPFNNR